MPRSEKVINVAVRADLWARAKAAAALQKRPVKYLLEDALEAYLKVSESSEGSHA